MRDRVCPPKRTHYSFESRCRLAGLILAGRQSPHVPAAACGASRATGYPRWVRYLEAGWAGLADVVDADPAAAVATTGGGGGDRRGTSSRAGGAGCVVRGPRAARPRQSREGVASASASRGCRIESGIRSPAMSAIATCGKGPPAPGLRRLPAPRIRLPTLLSTCSSSPGEVVPTVSSA